MEVTAAKVRDFGYQRLFWLALDYTLAVALPQDQAVPVALRVA